MHRTLSLLTVLLLTLLTGCSIAPLMALSEEGAKLDTSRPLYLLSVVVKNEYKQRYQPRILNVMLTKDNGSDKPEHRAFRMDDRGTIAPSTDDGLLPAC